MTLLDRLTAMMQPHRPRVQKMFGGTAFLVNENLVIGTHKDGLILRVGAEGMAAALESPFASQMVMGGRSMVGWVIISADGCADDVSLQGWVRLGLAHNAGLPPGAARAGRKPRP